MLVSYKPLAAQIAADSRLPTSVARACIAALKQKTTVYFHTKEPCCPTRAARQLSEMIMGPKLCSGAMRVVLLAAAAAAQTALDDTTIRTAVRLWLGNATARAEAEGTWGPIAQWNTGAVRDMSELFCGLDETPTHHSFCDSYNVGASAFNDDISAWNTAQVTTMHSMFLFATQFNQPLNSWDISKVTDLTSMFEGKAHEKNTYNQPLDAWDVDQVVALDSMFYASAYNSPLNSRQLGTPSISEMFMYSDFDQDISGWDVSRISSFLKVFAFSAFNQPLDSWDVSSATTLESMFWGASAFNQSLAT